MKNKLTDLNNHLFAQLERLNDENLTGDELKAEIDRGKAITGIADKVIGNANLALEAHKLQLEYGKNAGPLPKVLEHES